MKMDIYRVINESKNSKIIDKDELDRLFSLANDAILLRIVAQENDKEEKSQEAEMAEIILKNRDSYQEAKREEDLDEFEKELNSEIRKKIKKNRNETKKKLFQTMDDIAKEYQTADIKAKDENANIIIFKLFLNEWNTKYAFTWKSFKNLKKDYEKTHILEGEDLFVLKSLLEKDPNIANKKSFDLTRADISSGKVAKDTSGKITDSTVFSKQNNTLAKDTIEKIKEKIAKAE